MTFAFVCVTWVFFRSSDFKASIFILQKMFFIVSPEGTRWLATSLLVLAPLFVLAHWAGQRIQRYYIANLRTLPGLFLLFFTLLGILFFMPLKSSPFIYFSVLDAAKLCRNSGSNLGHGQPNRGARLVIMQSALRRKARFILAAVISVMPLNAVRVLLLRFFFRYRIENSRVGFGTILVVESAVIRDSRIGPFNAFAEPMRTRIEGATIGPRNSFTCGDWVLDPKVAKPTYKRTLQIGKGTLITSQHSFDVCATISIGERSWIAGSHSQFWTHGAGDVGDIEIGNDCYVGSAARFASNSGLGNNVLLALGSVVTKRFVEDDTLMGGVPAKILKRDYHWREQAGK